MAKTDDSTEMVMIGPKITVEVKLALQKKAAELDVFEQDLIEEALRAFLKLPKRKAAV